MLGVSGARLDFALIHCCCSCRCHCRCRCRCRCRCHYRCRCRCELLLFEEAKKVDDGSRLLQFSRHLKRLVVA